jgi:hypothetical protein
MKKKTLLAIAVSLVFCVSMLLPVYGQEMKSIQLPGPRLNESKSLAQALKESKTTRTYALDNLSEQTLSNLLWSACGINRPGRFEITVKGSIGVPVIKTARL